MWIVGSVIACGAAVIHTIDSYGSIFLVENVLNGAIYLGLAIANLAGAYLLKNSPYKAMTAFVLVGIVNLISDFSGFNPGMAFWGFLALALAAFAFVRGRRSNKDKVNVV